MLWSLRALWDYANCQGLFLKIWSECLWALINYLIYDKLLIALNFAYSIQGAVGGFKFPILCTIKLDHRYIYIP